MFKFSFIFSFIFRHLLYFSFLFLLSCADAAKEASEFRTYSIEISVTGLADGESLEIAESKRGLSKTITENSLFTLPKFNLGELFSIEVTVNPTDKRCTVTNGTGQINGSSDNVNITCLKLFSISGNISGLEGGDLVLRLNAEEDLSIDKTDNFIFSTSLVDESPYTVTVLTQPSSPNQFCTVTNGSGTVSGANVNKVTIACVNSIPPTASNVSITDENDGNAVVGDSLTGNYLYNDVNGDVEGASTFRWLRNGVAISGAVSSTYILAADDVPTQIIFEVTPVATAGGTGSATTSAVLATGTAPVVNGFARYLDINMNGINDANDQLIILFDQNVSVNAVDSTHFDLPVTGDTFGTDATVAAGPASNEVTITLGTSPNFKTRQDFSSGVTAANSASGVDVAASITAGAIESASGIDAVPSVPIDLIPGYVASSQLLGTNNSRSVALGDLDGDGDLDMVVTNASSRAESSEANQVYINDGRGRFTVSSQVLGANSRSVALGDIDGDGDLDIAMSNFDGNRVYPNVDGAGSFADSGQVLGNIGGSVALGDIDGDGDLDMVVVSVGEADRVYRNDGSGNFNDSNQLLGANISMSVALGDVDGDGDLDMVVADGQANRVYKNSDRVGSFIDSDQALGTSFSTFVALGDVDGDGDLDMVVANLDAQVDNDEANRVYKNDGDGGFIDSNQALGLNHSTSVALGDVDGDGDLDMVVTNLSAQNQNRVYINDGAGNFIDSGQMIVDVNSSRSVALGDIDGDGDLDMVVGSSGGNRVYLNSLAGTE